MYKASDWLQKGTTHYGCFTLKLLNFIDVHYSGSKHRKINMSKIYPQSTQLNLVLLIHLYRSLSLRMFDFLFVKNNNKYLVLYSYVNKITKLQVCCHFISVSPILIL